jgi:hypothetical protein
MLKHLKEVVWDGVDKIRLSPESGKWWAVA